MLRFRREAKCISCKQHSPKTTLSLESWWHCEKKGSETNFGRPPEHFSGSFWSHFNATKRRALSTLHTRHQHATSCTGKLVLPHPMECCTLGPLAIHLGPRRESNLIHVTQLFSDPGKKRELFFGKTLDHFSGAATKKGKKG